MRRYYSLSLSILPSSRSDRVLKCKSLEFGQIIDLTSVLHNGLDDEGAYVTYIKLLS